MLKVYSFEKGLVKSSSSEDLGTTETCWTDCTKPTEEELNDISKNANIPLTDLQEVLDEEERPKVSDLEEYSLRIVRSPSEENGDISTTPIAIFVSKKKNNVITICLKETKAIGKMEELTKANKIELYEKGTGFFVYRLIDEILNEYFAILDKIEQKIDETEDDVVTKAENFTVRSIFSVKKALIFFFVLIPTLIASIYGMNFANNGSFNMPELYWKYGYLFALGLMAFSVIATYF